MSADTMSDERAPTLDEFISALYGAGWLSTSDAQWTHATALWNRWFQVTPGLAARPQGGPPLSEIQRIAGYVENELQGRIDATAWGKLRPLLDMIRGVTRPQGEPPREPTKQMVDAGEGADGMADDVRAIWRAMYDAAPAAAPAIAQAQAGTETDAIAVCRHGVAKGGDCGACEVEVFELEKNIGNSAPPAAPPAGDGLVTEPFCAKHGIAHPCYVCVNALAAIPKE